MLITDIGIFDCEERIRSRIRNGAAREGNPRDPRVVAHARVDVFRHAVGDVGQRRVPGPQKEARIFQFGFHDVSSFLGRVGEGV